MKKIAFLLSLLFAIGCNAPSETPTNSGGDTVPTSLPEGPLLGETAGDTPTIFAPGFISTLDNELNGLFSPDGKEFYYSLDAPRGDFRVIAVSQQDAEGRWSEPRVADFSGKYSDVDPQMTPDGQRIYFCSRRPRTPGDTLPRDYDIWYVDRQAVSWGEAVRLGATVNTERNDWYCSSTAGGNLYYATWDDERKTDDIFRVVVSEKGLERENIGGGVNTPFAEFDPFIAPDESYLIFAGYRPDAGFGGIDLYISYRVDGAWSEAQNLGPEINSGGKDYCPWVTTDGQYFFFTSMRTETAYPGSETVTLAGLRTKMRSMDNGLGNVYWVKADFIERMRPAAE
ncbi:MAG: hypothetical protein AAGN35_11235 [Bacteroidota bacterium]